MARESCILPWCSSAQFVPFVQFAESGNTMADARMCFTGLYNKLGPKVPGSSSRVHDHSLICHKGIHHLREIVCEVGGGMLRKPLSSYVDIDIILEEVNGNGAKGVVGK